MSYGGPPTLAEINRNKNRIDYMRPTMQQFATETQQQLIPPVNYNVAYPTNDELSSELLDPAQ